MIRSRENFYARNSNFPDGPENLSACSKLSSPGAHCDWFGCLKIFSKSRSNFYLENLSGFSVEESNFAGGEIEPFKVSSSVAQSTINGDSFTESLNNSMQNLLINAAGEMAAKEIGNAAHPTDQYGNSLATRITKAEQLALHATLGATISSLTGGDILSGAAAGVIGELTGESLHPSVENASLNRQTAIQFAGLAGSSASLLTSIATGRSDEQTASNMFAGQRVGGGMRRRIMRILL